jgi:pimeloyl-ACP methyl ester carboxylesterase
VSAGRRGRRARLGSWPLLIGTLIAAAGVLAAGVLGTLVARSSGQPRLFLDDRGRPLPESISEKAFVNINGARQGMFLKGRDRRDPVLLYLHGGLPDVFLSEGRPTGLEELFTVAWWEQRGSGMSFDPAIGSDALTTELLIADTLAVTDYLRERFGQDRIYLMAHSGGTFIGLQVVARAPERYHAYIGVAQMVDQLESERLAYQFMLERFRVLGDRAMVRRLEAAPVTSSGTPPGYLALRDVAMHRLGIGTTHDMRSIVTGLLLPSLTYSEYTLREKIDLWRAKRRAGVSPLWGEMLATDLATVVPSLPVPAYFFHGRHDYTCSYELAARYVSALEASLKGFYTFEQSAHSPVFEEPARSRDILRQDVLRARADLGDAIQPSPGAARQDEVASLFAGS